MNQEGPTPMLKLSVTAAMAALVAASPPPPVTNGATTARCRDASGRIGIKCLPKGAVVKMKPGAAAGHAGRSGRARASLSGSPDGAAAPDPVTPR